MSARSRRRWLAVGQGAALSAVFAGAAAAGVVLHADTGAARRLAASIANRALAPLFLGRLTVGEVTHLSLGRASRVRVAEARVTDPEGRAVIVARGLDATIDLLRLLCSLASGGPPEVVLLDETRIASAEIVVDLDASGEVGIARAFTPRPTAATGAGARGLEAADPVRLSIAQARLSHAWVRGDVVPAGLDADAEDARARVVIADRRLTVEVARAALTARAPRAPSQTGPVRGLARGRLVVALGDAGATPGPSSAAGYAMSWELDGDAAGVPVSARFGLDGETMDATLDLAKVEAAALRAALPALPVALPVELHARATGTTRALAVSARGAVGGGTFTSEGRLGLREPQPFALDAEVKRADAAAFLGPSTDVSGHLHAEGRLGGGGPEGTFALTTAASTIAGQPAPAVAATGSFDAVAVAASLRASEPGATVEGKVAARIKERALDFDLLGRAPDLRRFARAAGALAGSATARATGTLDLARGTIDARVVADGEDLARETASARGVHVDARLTGPVKAPSIEVTARAARLTLGARAPSGAAGEPPLTYPGATARARIVLSPFPSLRRVALHVDGAEGAAVDAEATQIDLRPGQLDVRGGRVTGLGAPLDVDAWLGDGALAVRVRGADVDLERVRAMTGLAELRLVPRGSHATLDVDVRRDGAGTVGHVDATVGGAPDGSSAALHATFRGRRVSARARVALGALGWVELRRAELELPGGLSLDAAERATGALDLEGALDLAQVAPLLGAEGVERIAGTAALSARIERGDERLPPTVRATATTRGLDLSLYRDGRSVHAGGIDGSVHLEHDGVTQATELSAGAWDASGPLASADGKASVPVLGWALGQASLDRRALAAVAVSARVDVPARAIAELPGLLERPDLPGLLASTDLPGLVARPDLRGRVEAHAELHGSLDRPDVVVSARADALRVKRPRGRARMLPVDATLDARWNGTDVVATLRLDEEERAERGPSGAGTAARTSGHVRGLVLAKLPVAELLAGRPLAWDASGALDVADLELAPLPLPEDLEGTLTGRVELRDLASAPRLLARAHVDDLGVSGARVAKADLEVTASDGSLAGHATLHQADGGSADAALLSSALSWRGLTATWDEAQPSRVDYKVSAMRLGLVRPFVRTIFPEIDGRIDGSGSAVVGPASQVFEGGLSLSEGRLYATAFGEEITDLEGAATFDRDGAFRVQGVRGKIGAGVLTASASGRMKGLRFASAEVVAVVPTKDGVPLSAEGANFAEATGEVRMRASMAPDRKALLVAVDVPRATVTLPDRGTQRLQPLDLDTSIVVGVRRPDGTLTPEVARRGRRQADKSAEAQADSLTARLTVTLGDDVRLEGRGLAIGLGGRTLVDVADELAVTGRITLKTGGTVDVQGRRFVIDHGTLTFVEGSESTNPTVVGAASWDAPDGTRVWVEFNGPLETGKLTLRSEPPYSKNEILSVLLFGRPDPNQARAGDARPSEADTAAAVGSGLVSSGLNKALGELDDDFELEQDRTSANRLRTNLGYKLRRNLKVKVGYASGLSQREPDTTYLFLEWLFLPKWSLLGTRGDKGTSILDVLFQHRY